MKWVGYGNGWIQGLIMVKKQGNQMNVEINVNMSYGNMEKGWTQEYGNMETLVDVGDGSMENSDEFHG